MVEGGKSKDFTLTKGMMIETPETWVLLMDKVCKVLIDYLKMQVKAGAQALQIFDSWVGCLSPGDYRDYVLPYTQRVVNGVKGLGVPVVYFSTGTSGMLSTVKEVGSDVIGFDWRIHLDAGAQATHPGEPGPLDTLCSLAGDQTPRARHTSPRRRPARPYIQSRTRDIATHPRRPRESGCRHGARIQA